MAKDRSAAADNKKEINTETNIVKATSKTLGMTYKELGEAIGYSESSIAQIASTNKVSEPMQKAIKLLLEVDRLNKEKQDTETLKTALKKLLNI